MVTPSDLVIADELDRVVSELGARFPGRSRNEIAEVVTAVYRRLAEDATIAAHLIPLTLNKSRRALSAPDRG
jgi:hypothetical protein